MNNTNRLLIGLFCCLKIECKSRPWLIEVRKLSYDNDFVICVFAEEIKHKDNVASSFSN